MCRRLDRAVANCHAEAIRATISLYAPVEAERKRDDRLTIDGGQADAAAVASDHAEHGTVIEVRQLLSLRTSDIASSTLARE
jgi:hypothetical protein